MKDYIINTPSDFNLKETLECGQCFHFNMIDENEYVLTAYGHMLHIRQDDKNLIFYDTDDRTYNELWREYFDIDRNYARIKEELLAKDDKLEEAISAMSGVRILNQEFFETLISFIISQNKQIPHIKKIVADISEKYGTYQGEVKGITMYTFPDVNALKVCHLSVKLYAATIFFMSNSFKSPHKIQMPEFSSEFPICNRMVSCYFLLCNDLCHARIRHAVEFFLCDCSSFKRFFCCFKLFWS